jgi:hypothetical protein
VSQVPPPEKKKRVRPRRFEISQYSAAKREVDEGFLLFVDRIDITPPPARQR